MNTEETRKQRIYYCSFCDKNQDQVKRPIAGPRNVYICNECIELCNQIVNDEQKAIQATE